MILRAYKYRIYPNAQQREKLIQYFGAARFIYNTALDLKKRYYDQFGKGLSKRQIQDQFVALKQTPEFDWLYQVNSQSILAVLGNVHIAYKNFFEGRAKFPRFKSRKNGWQAFQAPQHVQVDIELGQVKLPKIGWIKAKLHQSFDGKIKTCTIKRNPAGQYQIAILVETQDELPNKAPITKATTKGFDLGLKDFIITDSGEKIPNPKFLHQGLYRLGVEQKKFARMKKGSTRREKQKQCVALLHLNISNQRHDFLHQESSKLVRDSQAETLAFEDLHIKGMIRNKKLARHIADVAWGRFVSIIQYKCDWAGKNLIYCNRWAPSSKQCSCGYINQHLTLADREWTCPECHTHHDRDILAAQNIKAFALADALGTSDNIKCSPSPIPISVGGDAKGAGWFLHGSLEAPSIAAVAV